MSYLDVKAVYARLAALKTKHPTLCDVEILPKPTNEGREVKMLRLSAGPAELEERQAVLITAGVHAREWAQPDAILTFAEKLLGAYAASRDFQAMGYTLGKDYVKTILERLVVYIIPIVNPDGREYSFTPGNGNWRMNRNAALAGGGADINRNFDILWDFTKHYVKDCGVRASTNPLDTHQTYIGPAAESEPETRNVKAVLEDKRIRYYFDLHSAVPGIFHVWGLDTNQTYDPSMNFADSTWDGKRDALMLGTNVYMEYIPDAVLRAHQTLGALMQQAILRATGRSYPVQQSAKQPLYVATGTGDDYAFSRDMERRLCYTIEFGDDADGFQPDYATQFPRVEAEIHAAMAGGLDRLAGPPLTTAPPPPAPSSSNPVGSFWKGLGSFFKWFFGGFGRLVLAIARLVRPAPALYASPRPTPSAVPPPTSVHSLRLDVSTAGAGQRVRGVLLDASLDFTQVQKPLFYVFLQVPPRPGATGNLYWRVPDFRFLGPRELEFTVPPVGTGSSMRVPPGSYIVLCRYGFWAVEGDRLLTVS